MPVLVRWERSTDSVTLRGVELTEAGELLPDHAILHGVEGMEDNDHPDLDCVSIFIPRSEISYVVVCKVNNKNIESFCKYLNISKSEYDVIVDSFVNHDLFIKDNVNGWRLRKPRV